MKHLGRIIDSKEARDFAGWHYRVEVDHRGIAWRIGSGSVLCCIWPEPRDESAPCPARLVYLPTTFLEP